MVMTLNKAGVGENRRVVACQAPAKLRTKLETLGLVPGERVNIISSTDAGMIIEVKSSRLALGHDLAESLIVV